jgi:hypothetical protein
MPKCKYCDRKVKHIWEPEVTQGWARVVLAFKYEDGRPEETLEIVHCPDHLQEAFDEFTGIVARTQGAVVGIRLKESVPIAKGLIRDLFDKGVQEYRNRAARPGREN